ncbi:type II toxin-antitoxin system VapC family toxin [Aromatoleum evansii]|uniref:Ribonuclease VapC n=1 Tax=Aromatoleum evansii TaxID=59406 RepID=A0ABZ1AGD4_AROEV|nr:type II toxin-antitoxin system VapC family toxin [Aromatoleum evansii]
MILVGTSIWIDHLRGGDEHLVQLLGDGRVLAHPHVFGELALGNLQNRNAVLGALKEPPRAPVATDEEVLQFIEANAVFGRGIGYTDAHLLAAVRLAPGAKIWTRDKRVLAVAAPFGVAYRATH